MWKLNDRRSIGHGPQPNDTMQAQRHRLASMSQQTSAECLLLCSILPFYGKTFMGKLLEYSANIVWKKGTL